MTQIELHIHVRKDGNLLLTPERIRLLRLIEETGSLLTASKIIGISYNKAWKMMEAVNSATNKVVVEKQRGGNGGGGAIITPFGKILMSEYKAMEEMIKQYTLMFNAEINM